MINRESMHRDVINALKQGWVIDPEPDEPHSFIYAIDDYVTTSGNLLNIVSGTAWECDYLSSPRLLKFQAQAEKLDDILTSGISLPERIPLIQPTRRRRGSR